MFLSDVKFEIMYNNYWIIKQSLGTERMVYYAGSYRDYSRIYDYYPLPTFTLSPHFILS